MLSRRSQTGTRPLFLATILTLLAASAAWSADVRLVGWALSDNGDRDGFADTNETVELRVTLRNDSSTVLTGLRAKLATDDAKIERVLNPVLRVGDIEPGASLTLPAAFRFKVADVERDSVHENFSAAFTLSLTASGGRSVSLAPNPIVLQLDLEATEAGAPGVFFEGFEDGTLGAMAPLNIDAGKFSAEASDGYRCQYSDPDWQWSNTYGMACLLGSTSVSHGEDFFWNVVDGESRTVQGRSYAGRHSVWMGALVKESSTGGPSGGGLGQNRPLGETPHNGYMTTPMGVLEGLVTGAPLHLAAGKVCEVTRTATCQEDGDCPAGELCLDVMPELSFKHQISLPDHRVMYTGPFRSLDGGVVQAQLVDGDGSPLGVWTTLEPYANPYDQQRMDNFVVCAFDPVDDGNTEDDFYDPADPYRRLGPSSLCYEQWGFTYLGDTDAPFNPANLGNAEGPGLKGQTGFGTWVESRFDLSALRGQSILIRIIVSTFGDEINDTYEEMLELNPHPADDGWWIDDITVTDTVDAPAALSVDLKDNSALSTGEERPRSLQQRFNP